MISRYQLKFKTAREAIDLTKYETIITKVTQEVIGKTIRVRVTPQYFEIDADISHGSAIKIGEKISYYCPEIREQKKTYFSKNGKKISTQIFRRMD